MARKNKAAPRVEETEEYRQQHRAYLLVKAEVELRRNHVAPGLVRVVVEKLRTELGRDASP